MEAKARQTRPTGKLEEILKGERDAWPLVEQVQQLRQLLRLPARLRLLPGLGRRDPAGCPDHPPMPPLDEPRCAQAGSRGQDGLLS